MPIFTVVFKERKTTTTTQNETHSRTDLHRPSHRRRNERKLSCDRIGHREIKIVEQMNIKRFLVKFDVITTATVIHMSYPQETYENIQVIKMDRKTAEHIYLLINKTTENSF